MRSAVRNGNEQLRTINLNGSKIPIMIHLDIVPFNNACLYSGEVVGSVTFKRRRLFQKNPKSYILHEASAEGSSPKQVVDRIKCVINKGLKTENPQFVYENHACASFTTRQ